MVGREKEDKVTIQAVSDEERSQWTDAFLNALIQLPNETLLGSYSATNAPGINYIRD